MLLAALAPVCAFAAFLLLLLVSLSVPITHTIYVLRLTAAAGTAVLDASASATAHFGVWGYCISSVDVSVAGLSDDTTQQLCSRPRLGYSFDGAVQAALRAQDVSPSALSHALTAVLVLHPIACGLAFLALLGALTVPRWPAWHAHSQPTGRRTRWPAFTTLALTLLAALLTTAAFLIDVVFVALAKHRISNESGGTVRGAWGNAVWMVLGAAIALWLALAGALVVLIQGRRTRKTLSRY